MPSAPRRQTATIIPFPVRRLADNRLTGQDEADAVAWQASPPIVQCDLRYSQTRGDVEIGDFISIYRGTGAWATWGVARRGAQVNLWLCATGADIGLFVTMRDALAAIPTTAELPLKARA